MLLAGIGLYGLVSYTVAQRKQMLREEGEKLRRKTSIPAAIRPSNRLVRIGRETERADDLGVTEDGLY